MFGRRTGIKVGDIMTRKFVSVKPTLSVKQCAAEMEKNRVGSLIVRSNQKLLGIITEKDIIVAVAKKSLNMKAQEIMSKKVVVISPSKDIYDALVLMKKTKYRWLPVVIKGKVVGMLTLKDILRLEPSLFDIAAETMQIREEAEKIKRMRARAEAEETWVREGECEECGITGVLYEVEGRLLCESCAGM